MLSNYVKKLYHLFLELRKQFLSQIFIFPWFDNFFSFFYEFFHLTQRNWCIWFHEKKKIVYLIPFHKTEFSNSFCQRFFDSPFRLEKIKIMSHISNFLIIYHKDKGWIFGKIRCWTLFVLWVDPLRPLWGLWNGVLAPKNEQIFNDFT